MPADCYRFAASILLLRPAGDGFDILLLHKPRKRDAWQLPQGGFEEGETAEECAIRELKEEAGLEGMTVIGKSSAVYQYDFPTSFRRFRPDHICGQRIEFIFGIAPADAEVKVDGVEVNEFVWVKPEELGAYIKRKEYLQLIENLLLEAGGVLPPME